MSGTMNENLNFKRDSLFVFTVSTFLQLGIAIYCLQSISEMRQFKVGSKEIFYVLTSLDRCNFSNNNYEKRNTKTWAHCLQVCCFFFRREVSRSCCEPWFLVTEKLKKRFLWINRKKLLEMLLGNRRHPKFASLDRINQMVMCDNFSCCLVWE